MIRNWNETLNNRYDTDYKSVSYLGNFDRYKIPDSVQAYLNGVIHAFSGIKHGDKGLNEKYSSEYTDGFLYGLGANKEEVIEFIAKTRNKYRTHGHNESNIGEWRRGNREYIRYSFKKDNWMGE